MTALGLNMQGTGVIATTFPASPLGLKVELLINGTWTDISQYIYQRASMTITTGRPDESAQINPASLTLTLNNRDGRFTPLLAAGAYFPFLTRNTQIRVHVLSASATGVIFNGYRFWGQVPSWPVKWDPTGADIYVEVQASGILRQLNQSGQSTIGSPLSRYYSLLPATARLTSYWTCEDKSGSTEFGSATGGGAMTWTGTPSLASGTGIPGADPLPQLNGSAWTGSPGSYSAGGTDTYTTPGTYTWVAPGGVTSLTSAEAWSAGAGGGWGGSNDGGGSSAGGGEYAKETSVAVTPGTGYTVVVGAGGAGSSGSGAGDGGDSTFAGDAVTVHAHGGIHGGDSTAAGLGAAGTAGTGSANTTHHDGGAGALGAAGGGGAGGGSSAGTAAGGNAGAPGSGTAHGAGGAAPSGGAAGGAGGDFSGSCVDDQTLIWTPRGALRYDEVREGDVTLALDELGSVVRSKVTKVQVFRDCRPTLVTLSGPLSARVTIAHRWPVRTCDGLQWRTTGTLLAGDAIMLGKGEADVEDIKFSEPQVFEDTVIWCPTTEHGSWLAGRSGIAHFTGNKPA